MTIGIWVLGDQLWPGQAALDQCAAERARTPVILIESLAWVRSRPYHRQKLVLVWSAMRHFAHELQTQGWNVTYEEAEDFATPLHDWIAANGITELRVMQPSDRPFVAHIHSLDLPCQLTLIPNNQFLWADGKFSSWAKGKKSLLMEYFYREGRQRLDVLMEGKQPTGGTWNFDKDNRKPPRGKLNTPDPLWFPPDEITQAVMAKVQTLTFPLHGKLESFRWGVTRSQALQALNSFITTRLPSFGPYQDAMVTGEETMWHALLSPYLNIGLLHPLEVVEAAETAYHEQELSLSSVEGFIRQVLGWREYMHGFYQHVDDNYPQRNWFNHTQPLPEFFWDADKTDLNCLHQTLKQTEQIGYAHHIQRLMVLANFSLIAGLSPQAVEDWFHSAFVDAYDWVMQTNVIGMGLFADGGMLASKPYAASANYINKMSDYCKGCKYNPSKRTGENACPFNFFYWDFLARHRDKLKSQGRMSFILANLDKIPAAELQAMQQLAGEWHHQQADECEKQ